MTNIMTAATCAVLALAGFVSASAVHATPIVLADILDKDPLGYECVQSNFLEEDDNGVAAIAFSLTGKTRLPRTCLPEPCARALTPQELSNLTGTEMILAKFYNEWDDYYARYAEFCRKEVTAFAIPTVNVPVVPEEFWPPILKRRRPPEKTISICIDCGPPFSPPPPPPPPHPPLPDPKCPSCLSSPAKTASLLSSTGQDVVLPPEEPPAPVPLPPSGLLLGALMAFGALRSRR